MMMTFLPFKMLMSYPPSSKIYSKAFAFYSENKSFGAEIAPEILLLAVLLDHGLHVFGSGVVSPARKRAGDPVFIDFR